MTLTEIVLLLLCAGLIALCVWHARQQHRLLAYLQNPQQQAHYDPVPSSAGRWGDVFYSLHRLLRKHHEAIEAAKNNHYRFTQAIQASPNAMVMLDAQQRIVWCNRAATGVLGVDARYDIGQPLAYLIRDAALQDLFQLQGHKTGASPAIHLRRNTATGEHTALVQAFAYSDTETLVLGQDMTELLRTETVRRDFVANVSHELRTPLTVLLGYLELMNMEQANHEDVKSLSTMLQQARRMNQITDDLLQLARLEISQSAESTPFNVDEVLQNAIDSVQNLPEFAHTISLTFAENLKRPLRLQGKVQDIFSVFQNLFSNAVRYTPQGGRISCTVFEAKGALHIAILDNGVGIAPQHIARLTERFYRVDSSRSRATGGTGLGLAIVKHVLHVHQARLEIESSEIAPTQGSKFTVVWPASRKIEA